MKYLKRYSQINEVNINSDEFRTMVEDIRDILLELEDGGRIKTSIETTYGKFKPYIGFHLSDFYDYDGFYFNEVSEYVFRIGDYLGDNLKSCSVLLVGDKDVMGNTLQRTEIDITKEESTSRMLRGLAIENLIIQIK